MKPENGGPAFPRPAGHNGLRGIDEHRGNEPEDGMTLRDYFAAHAPVPSDSWQGGSWRHNLQSLVEWNYHYADEMLRKRQP